MLSREDPIPSVTSTDYFTGADNSHLCSKAHCSEHQTLTMLHTERLHVSQIEHIQNDLSYLLGQAVRGRVMSPLHLYVETLTPRISERDCIGKECHQRRKLKRGPQSGPSLNMTGVLLSRGGTDTRQARTPREGQVKARGENDHLEAKERSLRRDQPS